MRSRSGVLLSVKDAKELGRLVNETDPAELSLYGYGLSKYVAFEMIKKAGESIPYGESITAEIEWKADLDRYIKENGLDYEG